MVKVEECIITNMVMIYDNQGNILVQDRTNADWPGITFPGGHVEAKESFVKSAIREIKEETGLTISNLKICGFKQFTVKEYRYIVIYFKTNNYEGELSSSSEGKVFWIKREDLDKYVLANGFKEMVTIFENDDLNENYYFYENNQWHLENL
jgi:8-oxo-dGTP diphosphatase